MTAVLSKLSSFDKLVLVGIARAIDVLSTQTGLSTVTAMEPSSLRDEPPEFRRNIFEPMRQSRQDASITVSAAIGAFRQFRAGPFPTPI
jgi:hypothetical protein